MSKEMISQKKFIPVDIFEIKKYGVTGWQDEFFWPISDKYFLKLYKDIEEFLRRQIDTQPKETADVLLVQSVFRSEYLNFLHAIKAVDMIKKIGAQVLYSDKSLWYKDIVSGGLTPIRRFKAGTSKYDFVKINKSKISKLLKNITYNYIPLRIFRTKKQNDSTIIIYRALTPIMKQHIKPLSDSLEFTSEEDWVREIAIRDIPKTLSDNIEQLIQTVTEGLENIAKNNEIELHDNHIAYIQKITKETIIYSAKIIYNAERIIGERSSIYILSSGFGDIFSRALYVAIRRKGGKVTSFSHGGNIGLYDTPSLAFSELALSDEFITYTQKSVELFENIKNNHPLLRKNGVNIKSCDSDEFLKLWRRYRNKPLPKNIKRVMVIGYPHNQWRKPHVAGYFSLIQLDLELRIVDILTQVGYEVIYKAHPGRITEVEGIFESRSRVLKGYFQDCLDAADAFLFGGIRTTAFPIALCTNKPIIAFKMEDEPYKPFSGAMELLQKRCSFIHTDFDERNRIVFDKDRLLEFLAKDIKEPNTEYIERYYFPK